MPRHNNPAKRAEHIADREAWLQDYYTAWLQEYHAALRLLAGESAPKEEVDGNFIRTLRRRLGLSQRGFADRYHLSSDSIKNYEQGIRVPDRGTRLYIQLIAHDPEYVERALKEKR